MHDDRKDASDFQSEIFLKCCFTKRNRLVEFDQVFNNISWDLKKGCVRAVVATNGYKCPCLGIVVSKMVVSTTMLTSVHRNKIKRAVRESFRKVSNSLPNIGVVVVVRVDVKRGAFADTQTEIRTALDSIWKKILVRTGRH